MGRRLQEELTDSERALCRGSDQSVRDFCDEWQSYWAEWDEAPSSTSLQQNCRIDNVTKEMHCRMSAFCEGGHLRESDLNFLSYPCGKNCKGSLLLDCCNKCQMYSANPKALHVNGISCTGCEPENIAKAIDEANCYFNENEFKCTTMDKCHLGSPSQFEKTCNIIPCDLSFRKLERTMLPRLCGATMQGHYWKHKAGLRRLRSRRFKFVIAILDGPPSDFLFCFSSRHGVVRLQKTQKSSSRQSSRRRRGRRGVRSRG